MNEKIISTERLMNLLVTLRHAAPPGLTSKQIVDRVSGYEGDNPETVRKRLQRDRALLNQTGWRVISSQSDNQEVFRIQEPDSTMPVKLTLDEATFLASLPQTIAKGKRWQALRVAVVRLLSSALLADQGLSAKRLSEFFDGEYGAGIDSLPAILVGIRKCAPLSFRYLSQNGVADRKVDGWGIWPHQGALYLVGFDHSRQARRTFRLSRIVSEVEIGSPGSYQLGLEQALTDPLVGPEIAPRVKIIAGQAPQLSHMATKVEHDEESSSSILTLPAAPEDYWIATLSEFFPQLESIEPPGLSNKIVHRMNSLIARLEGDCNAR